MRHKFQIVLSIFTALSLVSCQRDIEKTHPVVFHEESRSIISYEFNSLIEFPAYHGGIVINHNYLNDNFIIQEEIIANDNYATQYWCNIMDVNGKVYFSVTPAADIGYDLTRDNIAMGEVFHLVDSLYIESDDKNIFLLVTPEGICAYSLDGNLMWSNNVLTTNDVFTHENSIFIMNVNADKQVIAKINLDNGKILESYNLSEELTEFEALGDNDTVFVGNDAYLYATNELGLYQLNIREADKIADMRLIMDWSSSNILPGMIKSINVIDEQTIEMVQSDVSSDEMYCIKYVRDIDHELTETEDIILAVFTTQNDYQLPVYYYNQENQNNRINIRDYSVYEQEHQTLRFNTDIAAGDSPDMVIMWQNDTLNSAISIYERADIFSDLTSILDNTQTFNYDDLLTYVTEPYKLDGKQYIFRLDPSAGCYFGNTAYFNGPVTVDEYLDICEENNTSCLLGKNLFSATIDDYYNERTAECTFNNGILAQQMTRSTLLQDNTNEQPLKGISLTYTTLLNYVEKMTLLEGDWVPVGYPNENRELCIGNALGEYFAIMETSSHKDIAVDFLHTLIQRNSPGFNHTGTEDDILSMCYGYTFYKSDIYKQVDFFKDKTVVINGTILSVYDDNDPALSKAEGFHLKLTQDHANSMCTFLNSITRRVNNASPVQKIFWEEYWAMGDRPIETMLDYVQSKVSLYLSEQLN